MIKLKTPLTDDVVSKLKAGDNVLISGVVYMARDAAHKRLVELAKAGKKLPFDLKGQVVYYAGPAPAKPGQVSGPAGPTTSGRMDVYTPVLLDNGLKGMVGKGNRNKEVLDSIKKNKAVYFAAVGGAAAGISKTIKKSEIIAYEDLGAEAVRRIEVEDFPAIVANDSAGGDLYIEGINKYKK